MIDHDWRTGSKDAPHAFTDEEPAGGRDVFGLGEREHRPLLAWVGENLTHVRRSVYEQRILQWSLGIGFVVGLAAHVVQVVPEAKRRDPGRGGYRWAGPRSAAVSGEMMNVVVVTWSKGGPGT
jgi:hypothetical protein